MSYIIVTSLAEVWIEICPSPSGSLSLSVTSLAEVWIEMQQGAIQRRLHLVTSLAEVWIEIYIIGKEGKEMSHFPCGSVD